MRTQHLEIREGPNHSKYMIFPVISRESVSKGPPVFEKSGSYAETNSSTEISIDERELGTQISVLGPAGWISLAQVCLVAKFLAFSYL